MFCRRVSTPSSLKVSCRKGSSSLNSPPYRVLPHKVPCVHIRNMDQHPPKSARHNIVFHGIQHADNIFSWNSKLAKRVWPVYYARNVVFDNCHFPFIEAILFSDIFPRVRSIFFYESVATARVLRRFSYLKPRFQPMFIIAPPAKLYDPIEEGMGTQKNQNIVFLTRREMNDIVSMFLQDKEHNDEVDSYIRNKWMSV